MKKLLLTALLLGTPLAAAQNQTATQTAPTLMLTAPVGTSAEYVMTTRVSMKLSKPTVEALPGQKVNQADLERMRQAMQAGDSKPMPVQTVTSKAFYKVLARDAAGKTTLLNTVVLPPSPGQKKAVTIRSTQTVAPDGTTELLKMESDDPALKAAFEAMSKEMLKLMQEKGNQQPTTQYGMPLVKGKTDTRTISVNMQDMLGSLLGGLTSATGGEQLFQKIQSSPLSATVATTYNGLTAQGQHSFSTAMRYQPWQVRVEGKGDMPTMQVEVLGGETSGTQLYRRDGLPGNTDMKINMKMKMITEMEGMRVQVAMEMTQDLQMQQK